MTDPAPRRPTAPGGVWRAGRGRRFGRIGRVIPIAVVQVIGTLAAARWSGSGGPPGPWRGYGPSSAVGAADPGAVSLGAVAVVLLVAGVVVLPFRWRWPVAVLVVVAATTVGFAFTVSARGPFVAALTMAIVNAWFRGHRVPVFVVAAVSAIALPWADVLTGRSDVQSWGTMLLAVAWLTATIALTELVRVRVLRIAEQRRRRIDQDRRRASDERVRIARELHDSVAHNMSLISLQAGVALHLGDDLPDPTRESLTNIRDASRDALVELRTILGVLRAVDGDAGDADGARVRDGDADGERARGDAHGVRTVSERAPMPGLDRVPELVDRARAAGVDVGLAVSGDLGAVSDAVGRNAFRIVQESVTNVMKHAPGHPARITIDVGPDVVDLTVRDEPRAGLPAGAVVLGDSGNGLIGMRERATAVGGRFRAGPGADGSWTVHARLPLVLAPDRGADLPDSTADLPDRGADLPDRGVDRPSRPMSDEEPG